MASHFFDTPFGPLHYDRRGMGDPLLLVHGVYVGASLDEYARNVAALARHFTVYALDLIGFGQSAAPRVNHTAEMHAHTLRDFIAHEIGRPAHVAASGVSCGLAVRLAVYDDALVNRLVLIAPAQPALPKEEHGLGNWLQQFLLATLAAGYALYETHLDYPDLALFLKDRYADPKHAIADKARRLHAAGLHTNAMMPYISLLVGYFDTDTLRWLRYVRRPTLVLWGDALGPPPIGQIHKPAVWSAGKTIEVIEGAKHWPHDEQSRRVNEVLEGFLLAE